MWSKSLASRPPYDRWVVSHSMEALASQQRLGTPVRLSVNLSGKSLGDTDLLGLIRAQLASTSIDPSLLIAEVTETAAITNISQAQKFIRTIKDLGCQFALDDFGAGFSSFYHLKHLPVDFLKIDGAFIKDLPHNPVDRHLVQAMVALARGLGKQTIAEFVGDDETLELLALTASTTRRATMSAAPVSYARSSRTAPRPTRLSADRIRGATAAA